MIETLETLVTLLGVIAVVSVLAARLKVTPAILLVLAGVGMALVPGLPHVELAPELVLLLVLPPVIYASAVAMSWREFRAHLRPISMLAVGCVVFTTVAAAAAAHYLLGFSWEVGFVLGAIVSPPDAMAPLSLARELKLPRRLFTILEGEGLVNDATALVIYRFAIAAVAVGTFHLGEAVAEFFAIVAGEIVWGIGVGWVLLRLRRWTGLPKIEVLLSLLVPYAAYWPPEYLGGSGVLATVAAGLYFSSNGLRLISAGTRLQGVFFWDFFIYLVEGMVFLITGLQARGLVEGIHGYTAGDLVIAAAVVSAAVIVSRFVWMYPATYLPRWLVPAIRRREPRPPWTYPFAAGFIGIRGIVSLAAALAIPLETEQGLAFPHRDLILFLTFCVILVTLVGQGLLLPSVIRGLGLTAIGKRERHADRLQESQVRVEAVEAVVAATLHARHRERLRHLAGRRSEDAGQKRHNDYCEEVEFDLIEAERDIVNRIYREGRLKDEARRRLERELDLRTAHLENLRDDE